MRGARRGGVVPFHRWSRNTTQKTCSRWTYQEWNCTRRYAYVLLLLLFRDVVVKNMRPAPWRLHFLYSFSKIWKIVDRDWDLRVEDPARDAATGGLHYFEIRKNSATVSTQYTTTIRSTLTWKYAIATCFWGWGITIAQPDFLSKKKIMITCISVSVWNLLFSFLHDWSRGERRSVFESSCNYLC